MEQGPGNVGTGREPAPVREGERFEVLDVLRGIAILGILAANLEFFRTSDVWVGYDPRPGSFGRAFFFAVEFLASGKFITALAFLLGLGLAMQYRRSIASGRGARSGTST